MRRYYRRRFRRRGPPMVRYGRGFRGSTVRSKSELKFSDGIVSVTGLTVTNPALDTLNGISQGTSVSERIGNKVFLKSIQIRGAIYPSSGAGPYGGSTVRIDVVLDMQPNGSPPAVNAIFAGNESYDFINLENRTRFRVLMSCTHDIQPRRIVTGETYSAGQALYHFDKHRKINRSIYYTGTGGGIADIKYGAIYVVCRSTSVDQTSIHMHYRLRFVDP